MTRCFFLGLALLATPAMAQTPAAPPAAPDAATLTAARAMLKAVDIQGQMRALGPRLAEATVQQMRQMFVDAKMPDGLQAQLGTEMKTYFGSIDAIFTPEIIDEMAAVYARHFSADELRKLTTMMQDPVMVRFRAETPNTTSEMLPIMFKAMQPRQEAFKARMQQIVSDWIKQHPEDKAKLRSPSAS